MHGLELERFYKPGQVVNDLAMILPTVLEHVEMAKAILADLTGTASFNCALQSAHRQVARGRAR